MRTLKNISVTPTLANPGAYSTGDVIGAVTKITDASWNSSQGLVLISLTVLDKAAAGAALDVFFFDSLPANSLGVDNAAFALNDLDLSKVLGHVKVVTGDYSASSANTTACVRNIQLELQPLKAALPLTGQSNRDLYMVLVSRGSPTYADGDLIVRLGLDQT